MLRNGRYVIVPVTKESDGEHNNLTGGIWGSHLRDFLGLHTQKTFELYVGLSGPAVDCGRITNNPETDGLIRRLAGVQLIPNSRPVA